jgi:multicomponent Na+:H+ antiporter subunit G
MSEMTWNQLLGCVVIAVGLAFDLLGTIGLVRLPDVYNRLQAATKCVTLGTCFILFGVASYSALNAMGIKALICATFLLLTSPVAAHAIARAAHISGVKLWEGSVVDKYKEDFGQPDKEIGGH